MTLSVVTPPATYPVTLAEAKAQARYLADDEDAFFESLIAEATAHVEKELAISLSPRTYRLTLDAFTDAIRLPGGPVETVTSVEYVDREGLTQTVDPALYTVDLFSRPQWIVRNSSSIWPTPLDGVNVVTVQYDAGFAELPHDLLPLKRAILLLVGAWFDNREALASGLEEIPQGVDRLMQPFRSVL